MPLAVRADLRIGVALESAHIGAPLSEPKRTGGLNSLLIHARAEMPVDPAYVELGDASHGQANA